MLVISRNTAFTYRDKPIDTKQIGRELGVRYVLEGEVQRSGNQVRVTAQLIDAETDAHLWAERFDRRRRRSVRAAGRDYQPDRGCARPRTGRRRRRPGRSSVRTRAITFCAGRAVRLKPPSRENRAEAIALFEQASGARSAVRRGAELVGDRAHRPRPRFDGRHRGGRYRARGRHWPSEPWPRRRAARSRISPRPRCCARSTDTTRPFPNTRPSSRSTATGRTHTPISAGASS